MPSKLFAVYRRLTPVQAEPAAHNGPAGLGGNTAP